MSTVGPVVEPEAVLGDHPGAPTRDGVALDDRHVVARADQVRGRGEPAEAGTDDDDLSPDSAPADSSSIRRVRQLT